MKALILAAGYGTRLERDLKNDTSGKYKDLIGVPKPLLPIGKDPLITHWTKIFKVGNEIDQVYVMTNGANHHLFEEWARDWPEVTLLSDGSQNNETRTGAVGCMNLGVQHFNIKEDLLIIAGDTLFYEDFQLINAIAKFEEYKKINPCASMLVSVQCPDELVHKHGILETDEDERVIGFLEKPQPTETTSRQQCPCFYFLNKEALPLLDEFLKKSQDEPMQARDATGNFVRYLYTRQPVFAMHISGRFDVGGLDSYIKCHQHFLDAEKKS